MGKLSKRMATLNAKVKDLKPLGVRDAVAVLKKLEDDLPKGVKKCKFDQTVTVAFRLGIDARQADQRVRGSLVLPHGIGKSQRVAVFAQGANAAAATAAGADIVGAKDLADKIKDGFMDFDVLIATPDMMGLVGPLGRVLGPRGLMPSPRAGTVSTDVATTVKEYKAGKVEFKNDDAGNLHCIVGRLSFSQEQLSENAEALIQHILSIKPSGAKGIFVRNVTLGATMSPSVVMTLA